MEKLQEELGILLALTTALHSVVIPVSANMSFPLSAVTRYEAVELLDDAGSRSGVIAPMLFFNDGGEVQLTKEQNEIFKPVWNLKGKIDNKLISCAASIVTTMYQQPPPLQPPPGIS